MTTPAAGIAAALDHHAASLRARIVPLVAALDAALELRAILPDLEAGTDRPLADPDDLAAAARRAGPLAEARVTRLLAQLDR